MTQRLRRVVDQNRQSEANISKPKCSIRRSSVDVLRATVEIDNLKPRGDSRSDNALDRHKRPLSTCPLSTKKHQAICNNKNTQGRSHNSSTTHTDILVGSLQGKINELQSRCKAQKQELDGCLHAKQQRDADFSNLSQDYSAMCQKYRALQAQKSCSSSLVGHSNYLSDHHQQQHHKRAVSDLNKQRKRLEAKCEDAQREGKQLRASLQEYQDRTEALEAEVYKSITRYS